MRTRPAPPSAVAELLWTRTAWVVAKVGRTGPIHKYAVADTFIRRATTRRVAIQSMVGLQFRTVTAMKSAATGTFKPGPENTTDVAVPLLTLA